jgi:hypothetical protein
MHYVFDLWVNRWRQHEAQGDMVIVRYADGVRRAGLGDLFDKYPQFYWNSVFPYTQDGIRYLNVTSAGRQWIAGLYSNVFRAERDLHLSGPQA